MRLLRRTLPVALAIAAVCAGAVAAAEPSQIALSLRPTADGSALVTATVTDASGERVEGVDVTFNVRTAFGWLRAAEVKSGPEGTAEVLLPASSQYAEIRADAGSGVHAELLPAGPGRPEAPVRPGRSTLRTLSPQPGFISPYPPPQIVFVALILGGIWMTYGYLVWLLSRFRRAS